MLVLSRKLHEKILFPDFQATVEVVAVKSGVVRLGINAPPNVKVLREELQARAADWEAVQMPPGDRAVMPNSRELRHFLRGQLNATGLALELLHQQFLAGQSEHAQATLAKLGDDFELLRERLENAGENVAPQPAKQPRKVRKALLVEDNQNERELLAGLLRMAGVDVDTAGDGADALDYLRTRVPPDMMLLDMAMPRCDGPTTVRAIRQDPAFARLKIFAVTGHSPDEFPVESGPAGINGWFCKPINPQVLVHDLTRELDSPLNGLEPATVDDTFV
jgi:two-component system, OmpR family, response regulator